VGREILYRKKLTTDDFTRGRVARGDKTEPVHVGDLVHALHVRQDDPKAEPILYETAVFKKD